MNSVKDFYNGIAKVYETLYDRKNIYDIEEKYPANYFRLQMLINLFIKNKIKKVLEIGTGNGIPLANLFKIGMDVYGIDIADEMVKLAKENILAVGGKADNIFCADIQDPVSYSGAFFGNSFDGILAMGVMPHIEKDDFVINNINCLLKPGGKVFIEFRNKIFSLFTFNNYTIDFILNDLLRDVDKELKNIIGENLSNILLTNNNDNKNVFVGYNDILSKFHNPLCIEELFTRNGFTDINILWYHYHAAPPQIGDCNKDLFRRESIKMENSNDWRSMFLCSAFVVEATKVK